MSEFRQDLVSGEWIILAPERAKRPHEWPRRKPRVAAPKSKCPFEDLKRSGNWPPILLVPDEKNWKVAVIPNKYPALTHRHLCAQVLEKGPYKVAEGVGHHEVVIGRDHDRTLARMSPEDALLLLRTIQSRYRSLAADDCVQYVQAFFNWGPTAGASIYHPHYQIIALPIVPPEIQHSLEGSEIYFLRHQKCAYCVMLAYERKNRSRIIAENSQAVVLAPYAPLHRFEVRLFPKRHGAFFEDASLAEIKATAGLLRDVLGRIAKHWGDPDLNFYIHSAPSGDSSRSDFYHWHLEIVPKDIISPSGGFELGTEIDINPMDPDRVAAMLRGRK